MTSSTSASTSGSTSRAPRSGSAVCTGWTPTSPLAARWSDATAAQLRDVPGLTIPWTDDDVERGSHFGFAILLDSGGTRDRIASEMANRGIQTTHYPAITSLSAYRHHGARARTEDVAARHLVLPLSSTYGERDVDLVARTLTALMTGQAAPAG